MSIAARISAFAALLAAVFAISVWVGHTYGPDSYFAVPQPPAMGEPLPGHAGTGR